MLTAFRLFLKATVSRSRLIALLAIAAVLLLLAFALGNADGDSTGRAYRSLVQAYGLGLLVPVVSLVFAGATLGDPAEDRTLVYLWLTPLPRWRLALAAWAASLVVALPLAALPIFLAVLIAGAGTELAVAAAAASSLAILAYTAIFLGLGFRVRRALAWGLAYVLIWEGAVARVAKGAARASVNVHVRSLLAEMTDLTPPRNAVALSTAIATPLVVSALALAVTVWWLRRAEVA